MVGVNKTNAPATTQSTGEQAKSKRTMAWLLQPKSTGTMSSVPQHTLLKTSHFPPSSAYSGGMRAPSASTPQAANPAQAEEKGGVAVEAGRVSTENPTSSANQCRQGVAFRLRPRPRRGRATFGSLGQEALMECTRCPGDHQEVGRASTSLSRSRRRRRSGAAGERAQKMPSCRSSRLSRCTRRPTTQSRPRAVQTPFPRPRTTCRIKQVNKRKGEEENQQGPG